MQSQTRARKRRYAESSRDSQAESARRVTPWSDWHESLPKLLAQAQPVEVFSDESWRQNAIEVSFPENLRDPQGSKIKELVETLN